MIIGIDLGTTHSLAGYHNGTSITLVKNALGHHLTPSVVGFSEEGEVLVGKAAKERLISHPESTFELFKRTMGTNKEYNCFGNTYLSSDLSALILQSLVSDIKQHTQEPIEKAIISVPAYFNDIQRRDTLTAAQLAGLNVERLINEPTAAAVAYGIRDQEEARYMIFDLGGGTFDISIVEKFEDIIEVVASTGDNYLGGENFTELIYTHFLEVLGINDATDKIQNVLRRQAEVCKMALSEAPKFHAEISLEGQQHALSFEVKEFEQASKELIQRMKQSIRRAMRDANFGVHDIDQVVLVGGATKMPMTGSLIEELFQQTPQCTIDPEEVVGIGSATVAYLLQKDHHLRDIILTDVTPHSLGTEVYNPDEDSNEGLFSPIIERNTIVPCSREKMYYPIRDNQKVIDFNIYQGESRYVKNNVRLGNLEVQLPTHSNRSYGVSTRFTYDTSGVLEVMIKGGADGKVLRGTFHQGALKISSEEIEKRFDQLAALKVHPRDKQENRYLLTLLDRIYEEALGSEREMINEMGHTFGEALQGQDPKEIDEVRERILQSLRVAGWINE